MPKSEAKKYGLLYFLKKFCGDKSPFCGTTGTVCFGLWLTLPIGFKARLDGCTSTCTLLSFTCNGFSRVNFDCPLPGPNFTPWYGEGTTRVTTQCHFKDWWQRQIQTHNFVVQSTTPYRLSYLVRLVCYTLGPAIQNEDLL